MRAADGGVALVLNEQGENAPRDRQPRSAIGDAALGLRTGRALGGLPDPGPSVLRPPGLPEPYELGLGCERTIWFAESHSSKRESERRAPEIDPGE